MADVSVLRKQIKKFVDVAAEKGLEIACLLFNASKSTDWWNERGNTISASFYPYYSIPYLHRFFWKKIV